MTSFKDELQQSIKENKAENLLSLVLLYACQYPMNKQLLDIFYEISDISEVKFSEHCSSAALAFSGGRFYLLFNKEFLNKYVTTPDCLLFVVLHELFHKINGDLFVALGKEVTQVNDRLANIAFDLYINSQICNNILSKPVKLLEDLYANQQEVLLRILTPPYFLKETFVDVSEFKNLSVDEKITLSQEKLTEPIKDFDYETKELLVEFYKTAWFKNPTVSLLYSFLLEIKKRIYPWDSFDPGVIIEWLLGNHNNNQAGPWEEWLRKRIKAINGAGVGGKKEELKTELEERNSAKFFHIVRKAISPDVKHFVLKEMLLPEIGFIPFLTRKETFFISKGWFPLYYPNPVLRRDLSNWQTVIYIDVSSSMEEWWGVIYGLVMSVKDLISLPVYGFSEKVFSLDFSDIKEGKVITTMGTDINCVMEHALERNYKKVLIITDGLLGRVMRSDLLKKFKKSIEVYMVIINELGLPSSEFVEKMCGLQKKNRTWWCFPEMFSDKR